MKRLIASLMTVLILLTVLPLGGIAGAAADTDAPVFSLNILEESDTEVKLAVKLDSGKFNALDLTVKPEGKNIGECTRAVESMDLLMYEIEIKSAGGSGISVAYKETGKLSAAVTVAYDKAGTDIVEYTYSKIASVRVTKDDFSLSVSGCELDGNTVEASTVINLPEPHVHSYKAVVTKPTCTKQGYTTYTCSCGDSYKADYTAEKGHSYKAVVTAPTCTKQGYTTYTCSSCGDSYKADYTAEKGHSYNAVVTAPTCTKQGYTTYTCSCGDSYKADYVPAKGHSYNAAVTKPTCTEQGYTTYTCSCGDSYKADYVPAKGHTEGEWVIVKEATEEASGLKKIFCTECEAELDSELIPRIGAEGQVNDVTVNDVVINYKKSAVIVPDIDIDDGLDYTVEYKSSNSGVVSVDKNGNVYGAKKGSAVITCTVTDELGNEVSDTCTVNVKYTWWQWIIVIVLFGWIWY